MMISAVGKKKNTAASTHKLMDEVPLCAAAAIQRGPSTAAMLNSSTSQKPMARRSCDFGAVSSAIHSFHVFRGVDSSERHHSILSGNQPRHSQVPTSPLRRHQACPIVKPGGRKFAPVRKENRYALRPYEWTTLNIHKRRAIAHG